MTSRRLARTVIVAAVLAGPAAAQTPPTPAPILLGGPASLGAVDAGSQPAPIAPWDTPSRPRGLGLAVTDRVELVASAGKERSQREWLGRRAAGPSRTPHCPRLSLLVRW